MKILLPILLAAILLTGCSLSPYRRGMASLEKDSEKAERLFWLAVAKDDSPAEAYYQIALLHANKPEDIPLVIWALRQSIALNPDAKNSRDIRDWLKQLQAKFLHSIPNTEADSQNADLSSRIKHLEDFAIRQKKWIEDLTRENQLLRKAAAEAANAAEP
jgi:hypothetical protein